MAKRKASKKSRKREGTATKVPLTEKGATAKDTTKKKPVEEIIPEEKESEGKQITGKRKTSKKSRKRKVTAREKDATAKYTTRKRISKTKKESVEEESEEIHKPKNKKISGMKQDQVAQFEGIKQKQEKEVKINKRRDSEEFAGLTEIIDIWRLFQKETSTREIEENKRKLKAEPMIRFGPLYQARVPKECQFDSDERDSDSDERDSDSDERDSDRDSDELLWEPDVLSEKEVKEFLAKIRKEEWKGMNEKKLLTLLQRCNYDTDKALKEYKNMKYIPKTWTQKEWRLFEEDVDNEEKLEVEPMIRVGSLYQARVPKECQFDSDERDSDELLWEPDVLSEKEVKEFLTKIRKEEWKGMNEEKLLTLLQRCNYDTDKALKEYKNMKYIPKTWTQKECCLFEEGLDKYGKQFFSIQQMIQTKTSQEVAEFYYVWKKTERYDMFMNSKPRKGISEFRTKNREKMSKVTDIADNLLENMDGQSQKPTRVYCTRSMLPVSVSF
ncbi:mesoderm induction early response protein 1 [Trichonephila clavipes]|nr:mesoderm induction early response protein 1 [Trichonephila clavipes]